MVPQRIGDPGSLEDARWLSGSPAPLPPPNCRVISEHSMPLGPYLSLIDNTLCTVCQLAPRSLEALKIMNSNVRLATCAGLVLFSVSHTLFSLFANTNIRYTRTQCEYTYTYLDMWFMLLPILPSHDGPHCRVTASLPMVPRALMLAKALF